MGFPNRSGFLNPDCIYHIYLINMSFIHNSFACSLIFFLSCFSLSAQTIDWNGISIPNSIPVEGKINGFNMGGYSYGRINYQGPPVTVESDCKQCAASPLICFGTLGDVSGFEYASMQPKANAVIQTARLRPGILRFPGGTHSGWYHFYEYDNAGMYDASAPVIDKGYGMSLIETAHLANPLDYCRYDSRLSVNENYLDGFLNYVESSQNAMNGGKIEVTYVANLLTHFRFPSTQALCTSCARTKAVVPMDNFDATQPFSLAYAGNEALFNNDQAVYRFELYYKETQDAISRIVNRLDLDTADVVYVEMGNEYYSTTGYPNLKYQITVDDYAKLVEIYSTRLKTYFDDSVTIKTGAVTKPGTTWQTGLISRLGDDQDNNGSTLNELLDAVIYHHYYQLSDCLNEDNIKLRFDCARAAMREHIETDLPDNLDILKANFPDQKIWITEWNMLKGTNDKNLSYLNTILHASFVQEYALALLAYNTANNNEVEMATHHRLGDHNVWSAIQVQEGDSSSAHYRSAAYAMEYLGKLYEQNDMRSLGNLLKDGPATYDAGLATSEAFYQPGDGTTSNERIMLYYSNKTATGIPVSLPATIDGKMVSRASLSMLYGDHLFTYGPANTTAGKNRFKVSNNNETYNADLNSLGFGDIHNKFLSTNDSIIDANQPFSFPPNSIGVLELDLGILINIGEEVSPTFSVKVYPSPASELISVDITTSEPQTTSVFLLDSRGRQVYDHRQILHPGTNQLQVDVSLLPEGLYLLRFKGQREIAKKLLIQR